MPTFLEIVRTIWPIAAVLTPLILGAGFLWLRTQFPTKTDLAAMEERIRADIEEHERRLDDGSKKMADYDKRIALVEDDCESSPSKADLSQANASLAGRMSGVESSLRGQERQLSTLNTYLHTLIEKGLGK